ncbi:NAD(P)-binding protein [Stipitochalara longipes BDJ]|nr:NAD(P)-binding protein [Stipitochalara longipes BDJ]
MAPTIFITGVSGYIGGQILHDITRTHPSYQIRGLVRTSDQQKTIAAKYPSIHLVLGDLDSADILKTEAAKANVVLQLANADHTQSVTTILSALPKTSTLIHLSGAASISSSSNGLGRLTPKKWSDIADLSELTTFDHSHFHAVTDQTVLSEGKKQGIRTALAVPPVVYGKGEGEIKKQTMVFPWYVDAVKKRGGAFRLGEGTNVASVVHVRDLSSALIFLVEESLKEGGGKADWGEKGWYFFDGGEYVFRDMAKEIAEEMKKRGLIEGDEVEEITVEEAKKLHPYAELLWGGNMRVNGQRIKGLGWSPVGRSVSESIPELFE